MGATNFETRQYGESAKHAFERAVDDALYYHGHGGYTGTIAEKRSFVEFTLPEGMDVDTFIYYVENCVLGGVGLSPDVDRLIKKAVDVWHDKWGPAVCVATGNIMGGTHKEYVFFGLASC